MVITKKVRSLRVKREEGGDKREEGEEKPEERRDSTAGKKVPYEVPRHTRDRARDGTDKGSAP